MELLKVHKVLLFTQKAWMSPYILKNTEIRKTAMKNNDKITVDFAKLMNNSAFGKTCEDPMRYKKVSLICGKDGDEKIQRKVQKKINHPCFEQVKIYNENFAAVMEVTQRVKLNKPRFIGMSILALSKTLMYDFHYNFILEHFPGKEKKTIE